MKSRSSTGVGQKIDLEYDVETMRITDEDSGEAQSKTSANDIMSRIRATSNVNSPDNVDYSTGEVVESRKIAVDVQGSKLKNMLNSLKKS
jgi:hypothetical protein